MESKPARTKQHWSKQEIADLLKLYSQFGSDYTSIAIQMKDRAEGAIKSKIQRLLKKGKEKKKTLSEIFFKKSKKSHFK